MKLTVIIDITLQQDHKLWDIQIDTENKHFNLIKIMFLNKIYMFENPLLHLTVEEYSNVYCTYHIQVVDAKSGTTPYWV